MKRNIDFIISKSNYEEIVLRFYPRSSHVHGFGENCPKAWEEVYKVYLSYSTLRKYKLWETQKTEVMYEESYDECSAIDSVSSIIRDILLGDVEKEDYQLHPFGDGTSWRMEKYIGWEGEESWNFTLFQTYTNKGYRFSLHKEGLRLLADTIDYYLEYMLKHSEPI